MIARQQKMIAVVDGHAERGIVIRTAAAADERRGLVHDHTLAARGKLQRGGQSGKAGSDNVDGPRHHTRLRSTMKRSRARGSRTRARGGAKPRATR